MVRFSFYNTIFDSAHKIVVNNPRKYFADLHAATSSYYTTPPIDVVDMTDELTIDIPVPVNFVATPNYAVSHNGETLTTTDARAFYFVETNRVTPTVLRCKLTLDVWAMAVRYSYVHVRSGILVASHDMADVQFNNVRDHLFTFPVQPICGELINASVSDPDDTDINRLMCVMSISIINDDIKITRLVASNAFDFPDQKTSMLATAANMSRANKLNMGTGTSFEIQSINRAWLVPRGIMNIPISQAPNAEMVLATDQSVPVYALNDIYNIDFFLSHPKLNKYVDDIGRIMYHRVGNFGTNFDATLTGAINNGAQISFYVDWNTGHISAFLRRFGESIEFMSSLTLEISALQSNERALSRFIGDGLGLLSTAVSIGGGIASGNPATIIAGATTGVQTVANMATRVPYTMSQIDGVVLNNMNQAIDINTFANLPCYGYMDYKVSNETDVRSALTRVGYVGRYPVEEFSLTLLATPHYGYEYNGSFRQFEAPVIDTGYAKARDEIERMCVAGFTLYDSNKGLAAVGAPLFVPLDFTAGA